MTLVLTTLEVSCSAKARNKCGAEIRAIISDLRGGDLDSGMSYYLPDEELALTFLTPWPEAFDPDNDWAMDSEAEQVIRDRLLAVDPSVHVISWETFGELTPGFANSVDLGERAG